MAEKLGYEDFKASNGWIEGVMRRHNFINVKLHGEAGEKSPEEAKAIIDEWKEKKFFPMIEKYGVRRECICNADQTRLCYQKLPNSIHVDKAEKSSFRGAKRMKDKNGVTLMVCTSADGQKCPVAMVGSAKRRWECLLMLLATWTSSHGL